MGDFKWRHFRGEMILWAVRWYCKQALNQRSCHQVQLARNRLEFEADCLVNRGEQVIDFPGGQDRQAARIGTHETAIFTECRKYTYCAGGLCCVPSHLSASFPVQKLLL